MPVSSRRPFPLFRGLAAALALGLLASAAPALAKPASLPVPVAATPAPPSDAEVARQLDALLTPLLPADRPGAAILVARNGVPIYRKAFGRADVQAATPLTPDAAFRIGSVTKQFTAALVMQQVEAGKIRLQDDITKYLPDYPTQGKTITVENLLTQTSGIANYTALPAWQPAMTTPVTHEKMLDFFKDVPLAFEPGTRFDYSNSNYYLLGMILEKVTGKSYADLLQARIFKPLGMTHSGYGHDTPSLPGEVTGHALQGDRAVPAEPLSMTHPYAAGAIVSTVDDLLKWDNALNAGKILKKESLARSFTPFALKGGAPSSYGYGWVMTDFEGHPVQQHNGGINGFVSQVVRLPQDHVYIAILVNTEEPPFDGDMLTAKITGIALGQPLPEPGQYTMTNAQLDAFVGVYAADSTNTRVISRDGARMFSQRKGGGKLEIFPISDSTFAFAGRATRLTFQRNADGRVVGCRLHQSGIRQDYTRTSDVVPGGPVEVTLTPAQLEACVGKYALAPTFSITVTHEDGNLFGQATGQPKFQLYAESPTRFFLKVVDAQLEFDPGADGRMQSLTLHQNGQHIPGKRAE